jgi:hypothetical protein
VAEKEKRLVKVAKYRILKPAGEMTWRELGAGQDGAVSRSR